MKALGKKLGDNYFTAGAAADEAFAKRILKEAKMAGLAKIRIRQKPALGDDRNEIALRTA